MISIDEAIAHAREVAKENRYQAITYDDDFLKRFLTSKEKCKQCAEEHEQLAEWLEELQNLKAENTYLHDEMQAIGATMGLIEKEIRNKAIDDFIHSYYEYCEKQYGRLADDELIDMQKVSQQLKAGGIDG